MPETLGCSGIFLALAGKACFYMGYKFQFTYTPFLTYEFDVSQNEWIFSQTLAEIAILLTTPLAIIFEKLAPNKVMGWGLAIPMLTMFLIPLGIEQFGIPSYPWIIVNRIAFGLGYGIWLTAIGGIIGDFTAEDNRGRAFGIIEFSWTLTDFFMPLIGLSLRYWPASVVYYFQGVLALVVAAGILCWFPKRAKRATKGEDLETVPLIQRNELQSTSKWSLLWSSTSIGMFMFSVLSSAYMITFSFYGIWLKNEHGYTSDEVGAGYFITFTVSGVIVLVWSVLFSDRVGLIKSAQFSALFLVLPIGMIFTFMNTSLSTTSCLWLLSAWCMGTEGMFVTFMGYITTKEFSSEPLLMFALNRTGFSVGKIIWVCSSPYLYSSYGKMLGPSVISNKFGLLVATSTLLITLGLTSFIIGRRCEKRVHEDVQHCI